MVKHRYTSEAKRVEASRQQRLVKKNVAMEKAIKEAVALLEKHKPGAALECLKAAS